MVSLFCGIDIIFHRKRENAQKTIERFYINDDGN